MELDELLQRIRNLERAQALADKPSSEPEFTMQELKADNQFLRNLLRDKDRQMESIQTRLDHIMTQLDNSSHQIESLLTTISELHKTIATLQKEKSDLQSRLNVVNKEHYGSSKRQNGRKKEPL